MPTCEFEVVRGSVDVLCEWKEKESRVLRQDFDEAQAKACLRRGVGLVAEVAKKAKRCRSGVRCPHLRERPDGCNFFHPRDEIEHCHPIVATNDMRARNGSWYTNEEMRAFDFKSTDRRPRHGNCDFCFRVGIMGEMCKRCEMRHVKAIFWERCFYVPPDYVTFCNSGKMLDAFFVSKLMRGSFDNFEETEAEYSYYWVGTPFFHLTMNEITAYAKRISAGDQRQLDQHYDRVLDGLFDSVPDDEE